MIFDIQPSRLDLNVDDDTVTSTSQFVRDEVIYTPAAGNIILKDRHFSLSFLA